MNTITIIIVNINITTTTTTTTTNDNNHNTNLNQSAKAGKQTPYLRLELLTDSNRASTQHMITLLHW